MVILPAVDIYEGKAVRLFKGRYDEMTVFGDDPVAFAKGFKDDGAKYIHLVDLEGARDGTTPNIGIISKIASLDSLFVEVGGGIRNIDVAQRYLDAGVDRVIIGTAAVKDPAFLKEAVSRFGAAAAVGVDVLDGFVKVSGWTENSGLPLFAFCESLEKAGVGTVICTDISRDGTLSGTDQSFYKELVSRFSFKTVASGGVSSLDDIKRLKDANVEGVIIGKAYYSGKISIKEALEVAKS